jgi:hypothetical protein
MRFYPAGTRAGAWFSRALRENFARPGGSVPREFNFQGGFANFLFGTVSAKDFSVKCIDSPHNSDRFGQLSLERKKQTPVKL